MLFSHYNKVFWIIEKLKPLRILLIVYIIYYFCHIQNKSRRIFVDENAYCLLSWTSQSQYNSENTHKLVENELGNEIFDESISINEIKMEKVQQFTKYTQLCHYFHQTSKSYNCYHFLHRKKRAIIPSLLLHIKPPKSEFNDAEFVVVTSDDNSHSKESMLTLSEYLVHFTSEAMWISRDFIVLIIFNLQYKLKGIKSKNQ